MRNGHLLAREGLIDRVRGKLSHLLLPGQGFSILENPTEELAEAAIRGRGLPKLHRLFGAGARAGQDIVRKEENYLWSTRRFPNNTANNTIGSGAITAGDYDFFGNGVGDQGSAMGYASIANLTYLQTNMDKGGKIPMGRGFALFELAVSCNASALAKDIVQVIDNAELRYEKQGGNLVIHHGPLRQWPGGTGVSGFSSDATTASSTTVHTEAASNGVPNLAAVRRFKQPRLLNANESFKYSINFPSANTAKANVALALSDFVEVSIWLFGFTYDRIPE